MGGYLLPTAARCGLVLHDAIGKSAAHGRLEKASDPKRAHRMDPPSVLLISIDTLRADHLG